MNSVFPIKAFTDNYIWCLVSGEKSWIVDPGQAQPVIDYYSDKEHKLQGILITHHHYDHTGGVKACVEHFGDIPVWGPKEALACGLTQVVSDGQRIHLSASLMLKVMAIPGHTLGHLAYYGDGRVFCGDTLFNAGCGRLFEGTAEQMLASLERIAALPPETLAYPAHEYTESNLKFAVQIEPDNFKMQDALANVRTLRQQDACTLPSSIGTQMEINPFLRCALEKYMTKTQSSSPLAAFTEIRAQKDMF